MEELVRLSEEGSRTEIEKGRILLKAAEQLLREAAVADVTTLHRHGGVVETILEREDHARVVVMGKRGVGHEYAADHIGSMIERVVRASEKPVLRSAEHTSELQSLMRISYAV